MRHVVSCRQDTDDNTMASFTIIVGLLVFSCNICGIHCYDNEDYEIFDLVEEINQTFYEMFALDSKASTSEIKKSYRRMAIKYHPDKNPDEGAAEYFRQIAAVYEILKDEDKRERYDLVLEHGLPDWRQPVFYYRRVRKLGLLELTVILTLILTVGHYIVLWASYVEKKYEAEEIFRSRQRKEKKAKGRQKIQAQEDREIEFELDLKEHLELIPRPTLSKLLPCLMGKGIIWAVEYAAHTPARWRELKTQREEELRLEQLELEEEERRIEELNKLHEAAKIRKREKHVNLSELRGEMMSKQKPGTPVVYGIAENSVQADRDKITVTRKPKSGEWSEEEMMMLAKAVAKFPGGIPERWHKIADMTGRSVKEVTAMSKNLKQSYSKMVDPKAQGMTGSLEEVASHTMLKEHTDITQSGWEDGKTAQNIQSVDASVISAGDAAVRRRKKQPKAAENNPSDNTKDASGKIDKNINNLSKARTVNLESQNHQNTQDRDVGGGGVSGSGDKAGGVSGFGDSLSWTQDQQKQLEQALVTHPRGTPNRWGVIADCIPGKSKEDCINRFKHLAEVVRRKKEQST